MGKKISKSNEKENKIETNFINFLNVRKLITLELLNKGSFIFKLYKLKIQKYILNV